VTIDGVGIGNWIYWTPHEHFTNHYHTQTVVHNEGFHCSAWLTTSNSGRSSALGLHSHRLVAISHYPPTLLDCLVMAAAPHYVALAQSTQKTVLPTVTPLLHVTQPLLSKGLFSSSTVLVMRKYATILNKYNGTAYFMNSRLCNYYYAVQKRWVFIINKYNFV
jgi:hypothetical protein